MIDALAGLRFAPPNDSDGKQGERYTAFVREYFPERYAQLDMGPKLWAGLRCRPLHNFSGGVVRRPARCAPPCGGSARGSGRR